MARHLQHALGGARLPDRDTARRWLVACGQMEQAVLDAGGPLAVATLTDRAAEVFLASLEGAEVTAATQALARSLAVIRLGAAEVAVRIPEGYAWYALYPDSYVRSAARWAAAHPGSRVLVVGLRSIGTSLGAVVAAALKRHDIVMTGRITVRPEGHPFRRQAGRITVPEGTDRAIVVDEGPGLSGSSMAGVAEALCEAGLRPEAISFFPGHGGGPGREGNARVRGWWRPERCWHSPTPEELLPGQPAIFGGFAAVNERLATLAGVRRARQERLAAAGFAVACSGERHGWLMLAGGGTPLRREELSPALMRDRLAPYLHKAAYREAYDLVPAAIARVRAALAGAGARLPEVGGRVHEACRSLPLAGDGRMSPQEWLRTPEGTVLKRDATGSDCDHSWAGPQSVLWDVAGAAVDWVMDGAMRAAWLAAIAAEGLQVDPLALAFHEAGYCCLGLARCRAAGEVADGLRYEHALAAALTQLTRLA